MKKKRNYISNKKERSILSDVLPFELPVTFSNRYLYNFLIENQVELVGNVLRWESGSDALWKIIKLLFGLTDSKFIKNDSNGKIELSQRSSKNNKENPLRTIPFIYRILHERNEFRELALIHPLNQLNLIEFYEKYRSLILYYCGISPFSIRHPFKIAKYFYYKDKTHYKNLSYDHEHSKIEEFDKEYENLKTYFTYKDISNIYKFYESYKYHRCERKYDKLFKFDISKCFDSIYTHSITWALLNKDIVKDYLEKSRKTFGGQFDQFLQNINYGETNGILIGPEFSRIFAEIILQKVDVLVLNELKKRERPIRYRVDYEIFRYVDDFFIFYNEEEIKDEIIKTYRLKLREFKLYISDKKSLNIEKPLITGITIAKLKITSLLDKYLSMNELKDNNNEESDTVQLFYVSSNKLITRFKTIIKESNIIYTDVLNYTLACIDRKVYRIIKIYGAMEAKSEIEFKIVDAMIQILDFTFFLYTVSPKVNTTIKLSLILSKIIKFVKIKNNFNQDSKHLIFKKIYDDIFLVLRKYKSFNHAQVETLYLLIILKELGREYRLDEQLLCSHYGIDIVNNKCKNDLNYFSIVVLLFYIENKKRYANTREIIKNHILDKFNSVNKMHLGQTTELTLMFFDIISCPFLEIDYKNELFNIYGIDDSQNVLKAEIIDFQSFWFTKWSAFNFGKELEAKKSQDVY